MKRFAVKVELALDDPARTQERWVDVYKATDVAELAKRVIDYIEHDADCSVGKPTLVSGDIVGELGCDCGADNLVAELEQIAGAPE